MVGPVDLLPAADPDRLHRRQDGVRRPRRRRRRVRGHRRHHGHQRPAASSGTTGTGSPMFLGAMIMGPLTAYVMKHIDALWAGKIKPGFEMLVDNFSAGILGAIMAIVGMFLLAPPVLRGHRLARDRRRLPGRQQPAPADLDLHRAGEGAVPQQRHQPRRADTAGHPGGGRERASRCCSCSRPTRPPASACCWPTRVFGKGMAKATAPGAAIIQFFGGIHEVYFPYVLMKPRLILAMIAGGMTQIFINVLFDTGLRAPAAPGSIFAVYAQTPADSLVGVTLSVIGGAAVDLPGRLRSCSRWTRGTTRGATCIAAMGAMEAMKGKKSIASSLRGSGRPRGRTPARSRTSCSPATPAWAPRPWAPRCCARRSTTPGFTDVTVVNKSIANLDDTYDLVVTHQDLTDRAGQRTPSAIHVSVDNFMASPGTTRSSSWCTRPTRPGPAAAAPVAASAAAELASAALLPERAIVLAGTARTRDEAITEAGELLVASGAVEPAYVAAMHEREKSVSTYMGNAPRDPARHQRGQVVDQGDRPVVRPLPDGIDWNGQGGQVRGRHRRRGRRPPGAARARSPRCSSTPTGSPRSRRPRPPRPRSLRCPQRRDRDLTQRTDAAPSPRDGDGAASGRAGRCRRRQRRRASAATRPPRRPRPGTAPGAGADHGAKPQPQHPRVHGERRSRSRTSARRPGRPAARPGSGRRPARPPGARAPGAGPRGRPA